jgi:hypothetical protein
MEFRIYLFCPEHRNIITQIAIGAAYPRSARALCRDIEMNYLATGMNAGVGSTGGDYPDWLISNNPERMFNISLHGSDIVLQLPAAKM